MIKMTFTTGKDIKTKPAVVKIKPLPKVGDYMSLKSLKKSKGCKSCGGD